MNNNASIVLAAACLLTVTIGPVQAAEQVAAGQVSVVDGDTLELRGQRIRLAAIDAPEARQSCLSGGKPWPCGRRAAFALADLVARVQ